MHRNIVNRVAGLLCGALLVIVATTAGAEKQSESRSKTRTKIFDESSFQGYDAYTGPYGQFGVAIGEIDFDGADVDTGGGFTITGGYRLLPWLSAEGNVTYLGGGDVENTNREADFFSFTFGPKIYPLGFLDEQPMPEYVQPYGLIAIGGGEYDVEGFNAQSTFIARFIFGFDVWFTDHIGTFVEGGYHVADDSDIDGTGIFTLGAQYRF